jgi:hypothetical protein
MAATICVLAVACTSAEVVPPPTAPPTTPATLTVSPTSARIATGTEVALLATTEGIDPEDLVWETTGGSLQGDGLNATFRAPGQAGQHEIVVRHQSDATLVARTTVDVPGGLVDPFSIVMMPDTQNMIKAEDTAPLVDAMTDWIVDNVEALDIEFVTHVGDIVAFADRTHEWDRAIEALSVLDGVVPYSIAFGDHEYVIEEDKGSSTEAYRTHFGADRYASYPWYRGTAPNGLSHYQVFEAGGREFLHIALEWEPPGPVEDPTTPLGWARTVLEAHPSLPTIITTHAYLWDRPGDEGRFHDGAREGYVLEDGVKVFVGSSGEDIYRDLVHPFPQVFMVLGGHYHKRPDGDPELGEYHQVSTNEAGLPVFEMLANYQSWPNGGDGWLRTIRFHPGGGDNGLDRIDVRTYSPPLDRYQIDGYSAFSFDVSFADRFGSALDTEP